MVAFSLLDLSFRTIKNDGLKYVFVVVVTTLTKIPALLIEVTYVVVVVHYNTEIWFQSERAFTLVQ